MRRAHVGFPVEYQAIVNGWCGNINFDKVAGPPEFDLDGAGGLFYWTPARVARERITFQVTRTTTEGIRTVTKTFRTRVDDNTLTYPLFRDYLAQAETVPIEGRAHRSSFRLYYAEQSVPTLRYPIPVKPGPVETTGRLADWDISALPDGGRYLLTLQVGGSQLTNRVIIDRTAKPGWPKRVGPITHSPILADLDDDGRQEVIVVTHFGELYVWRIDGTELFEVDGAPASGAYSAAAIGDIDGDGRPEIVWATMLGLNAHRLDGTLVPGFPILRSPGREFRSVPSLADLDGDGVLDIVIGEQGETLDVSGRVDAYRYRNGAPEPLPGWPQSLGDFSCYASASIADLDGQPGPEVVVASYDRVYAWHADGTAVSGLAGARLAAPITGAEVNGAGGSRSSSQPALADLDGDGTLEVVIGSNVLRADGTPLPGWVGGKPGARDSVSPAIGDLDRTPGNGLEVVLGADAWHADGTPVANRPLSTSLAPAVLGDGGSNQLDTIVGVRDATAPGIAAFRSDGAMLAGYPKSLYGNTGDAGAPVIGDFDGDGLVDVAAAITDASYGGIVAIWDMWAPNHDEHHDWPMLGHDERHTGVWTPARPDRPVGLVASAVAGGVRLTWQDRSAVEDGYLVERSTTGAAWSWAPIAQLPADTTTYLDAGGSGVYRVRARRHDPRTGAAIVSVASGPAAP